MAIGAFGENPGALSVPSRHAKESILDQGQNANVHIDINPLAPQDGGITVGNGVESRPLLWHTQLPVAAMYTDILFT